MGFRNLEIFNLAMLGKHGWRLTTSPGSLCASVLKGRYFPSSNFMQATVSRGASANWWAIIAGREPLNVGMIRRIGDGTSVSIWVDSWVTKTAANTIEEAMTNEVKLRKVILRKYKVAPRKLKCSAT